MMKQPFAPCRIRMTVGRFGRPLLNQSRSRQQRREKEGSSAGRESQLGYSHRLQEGITLQGIQEAMVIWSCEFAKGSILPLNLGSVVRSLWLWLQCQ